MIAFQQSQPEFSSRRIVSPNMPVDFASYLLSTSPPGFDLHNTLRSHFGDDGAMRRETKYSPLEPIRPLPEKSASNPDFRTPEEEFVRSTGNTFHSSSWTFGCVSNVASAFQCKRISFNCKKKSGKKRVSFADDVGLSLVSIKLLTETSDTPPVSLVNAQILSSLTQGATAGVTETPPLALNFNQPASDYVAFREKLQRNCVCLENVILKDYNIIGTIKVKNIAFEKNVLVRYTIDNWESSEDMPATYAPTNAGNNPPFDTFSFEINIPPTLDVSQKMQFAVCYNVNSQQFWDNNDGNNYEVRSKDWNTERVPENTRATTDSEPRYSYIAEQCTEFQFWGNRDASIPYY